MRKISSDADIAGILTLDRLDDSVFRGYSAPAIYDQIFGGQTIAQALMAAATASADERPAHSFHAYFLKPGNADLPIDYHVSRLSNGRRFEAFSVTARQGSNDILTMIASFQLPTDGLSHAVTPPDVIDAETASGNLAAWREAHRDTDREIRARRIDRGPFDIVPVDPDALFIDREDDPASAFWLRLRTPLGDDPHLQRGVLTYGSDIMLLRAALLPLAVRPGSDSLRTMSLDHSIWFRDTPDLDRWTLVSIDSPWAGNGRGLNRANIFNEDGQPVASVTQESLVRIRR